MAEASDDENEILALTREIEKAQKLRRALVKLKLRLEAKVKIPCSATFKEYESFAKVDHFKNNFASVALASTRTIRELCFLACGIKCVDCESGQLRFELCFSVGPRIYSGYVIQFDEVESEGFCLSKYNLPEGLDVRKIAQKVPMKNAHDMVKFLKFVRTGSCALLHRKNQVKELKNYCAEKGVDVDVFTSFDVTYIEISLQSDILMLTSKTEKMSFILKYSFESYLPINVVYEKEHVNEHDTSCLKSCASDFVTLNLVEAFRCVKHVKRKSQTSTPGQLKQGTLNFPAAIVGSSESELEDEAENEQEIKQGNEVPRKGVSPKKVLSGKNTNDKRASQRIHKQTALESKSQVTPESSSSRHVSLHARKLKQGILKFPAAIVGSSESELEDEAENEQEIKQGNEAPRKGVSPKKGLSGENSSNKPASQRIHEQPALESKSQVTPESSSPRRISLHAQKFSENDVEFRPRSTTPWHTSNRRQLRSEQEVKIRPKSTYLRHTSLHSREFSDDDDEYNEPRPKSTSPRRISTHAHKMPEEEVVESRTKTASPRRTSPRTRQFLEEEDEHRPKSSSPRRISTHAHKMPEEEVQSRTKTVSPKRTSLRTKKFSEEDEFRPMSTSPRRISARAHKMPEEEVESRTKTASPRRTSLRTKKFSEEEEDEPRPKSSSPRQISSCVPEKLKERDESRIEGASSRTLFHDKLPEEDDIESRTNSIQKMPTNFALRTPMVVLHNFIPAGSPKNEQQIFSQKSSTPIRTVNAAQEEQMNDVRISDLSTIAGSDTNVQSLNQEMQNVRPVAASTPFFQPNTRSKRMAMEKKLTRNDLQMNSPEIHSDKYRQTQLHRFMKTGANQHVQEINKSIRKSPRQSIAVQYFSSSSMSESDEVEEEQAKIERKRKSGINAHKGTPVPKSFQSSRVKKYVTRQSVVSGKLIRRKKSK